MGYWMQAAMDLRVPLKYTYVPNNAITSKHLGKIMVNPYVTNGKSFVRYLNTFSKMKY